MAVSASGDYIPPMVIYKGKRDNPILHRNLPPSSVVSYSDTGYVNKDLFLQWIQHFNHNKRQSHGKTLLILDGHGSHTLSLEVLKYASSNDIEMVSLPPHTSHYLQPLDKVHFKPLKDHFKEAVRIQLRNNPGAGITRIDFPQLFSKAYCKVATLTNAIASFRCTGLYPLDIQKIPSYAFAPSKITDESLSKEIHGQGKETQDKENICEPSTSGAEKVIQESIEECRVSGIAGEGLPESDNSFEKILPFPRAPFRNKKQRKKAINTGSRVLTSKKYQHELTVFVETRAKKGGKLDFTDGRVYKKNQKQQTNQKAFQEPSRCDDDICGVCEGNFYEDEENEGWIQCQICKKWYHDVCAGVYGKSVVSFACCYCSL